MLDRKHCSKLAYFGDLQSPGRGVVMDTVLETANQIEQRCGGRVCWNVAYVAALASMTLTGCEQVPRDKQKTSTISLHEWFRLPGRCRMLSRALADLNVPPAVVSHVMSLRARSREQMK